MADNIPDAFQNGTLYSDDEIYKFFKFHVADSSSILQLLSESVTSSSSSFQAMMVDKDEITVMVPERSPFCQSIVLKKKSDDDDHNNNKRVYEVADISYRLITFDVVLAPTLVGFMAVVTRALADTDISVLPFAAYSRDHIFVSQQDFQKAMDVLERLKTTATTTT